MILSWLTLSCRLAPQPGELHEVTLVKLLYLYDPEACERIMFYNFTGESNGNVVRTVIWPVKNHVAASFRSKTKLWLSLHIFWAFLSILNMVVKERPCAFYAVLLPFTFVGLAMIIVDLVHGALFLVDSNYTSDEASILDYLSGDGKLNYIYLRPMRDRTQQAGNTSWISVFFAYCSFRGVVQVIINFWLVKDNYTEGVEAYRRLEFTRLSKRKLESKSSEYIHI